MTEELINDNHPTGVDPNVGSRIKAARIAQRMTLEDVAEASNLTKGFLSRLERNQVNASVAALIRICSALDLALGSLFNPASGDVVRVDESSAINFGGELMTEYLLTPKGERRIQAILSEISSGGGSGPELYSLPADVEFALVLEGKLEISFAESTRELSPGEAITFSSPLAHSFRAIATDATTRVLWVFSPALPDGERTHVGR